MRAKTAFACLVVVAGVSYAVGYAWKNGGARPSETKSAANPIPAVKPVVHNGAKIERVPIGGSPARGPADAKVTIVEFSELGCAFCGRSTALMKSIEARFPDVRWVWKSTGRSTQAAIAFATEVALAAEAEGRFWELHAALADVPELDEAKVRALVPDADALLNSGRGKNLIDADRGLAEKLNIVDTPTYFINGERSGVLESASQLEKMITAARARADAAIIAGVAPKDVYASLMSNASDYAPPKRDLRPPSSNDTRLDVPLRRDAPRKGAPDPRVWIAIFSDFTSPYCARAWPPLNEVLAAYPNKVGVELHHLPNPQQERSAPAARASIAAHLQGAFWKYHDRLYADQNALSDADLIKYAKELSLDVPRFERDLRLSAIDAVLDRDRLDAGKLNVRGTPALFVNGLPLRGVQTFETLKAAIDAELARPDPTGSHEAPKVETSLAPRRGKIGAKVEVVLWNDFECPACARMPKLVEQLLADYADDVAVVYKQYPLPSHPSAELASVAALAAHRFGKFDAMHDRLFAHQDALTRADLIAHARAIGLDAAEFERALDDPVLRRAVKSDITEGVKLGVTGTPTLFIGSKRLDGSRPYEELKSALLSALGDQD